MRGVRRLSSLPKSDWAIDVHTHCYYPKYMEMLRARGMHKDIPYVHAIDGKERLVILPGEHEKGRPIGPEYFEVSEKIDFMDKHEIAVSVLSLANPWLDFLQTNDAKLLAQELNDQLSDIHRASRGRIYGFGVIPFQNIQFAVEEIERMSRLEGIRGIILGTSGRGKGLDDRELDPIWSALERLGLTSFIHPHYGVGNEHYEGFGHSLFLALGFPFETTVAVSRLILAGTMDRFPNLKLLLAHSGGCLPFLAGRLNSCVEGEPQLAASLKKKPSDYLRMMFYDAVIYQTPAMKLVHELVSEDSMMFGTDHPFFPPSSGEERWPSTDKIHQAIDNLDASLAKKVRFQNARKLLNITE